jgi:hypothetical protein
MTFECTYFVEFEFIVENSLAYQSGDQEGAFDEKKIS